MGHSEERDVSRRACTQAAASEHRASKACASFALTNFCECIMVTCIHGLQGLDIARAVYTALAIQLSKVHKNITVNPPTTNPHICVLLPDHQGTSPPNNILPQSKQRLPTTFPSLLLPLGHTWASPGGPLREACPLFLETLIKLFFQCP